VTAATGRSEQGAGRAPKLVDYLINCYRKMGSGLEVIEASKSTGLAYRILDSQCERRSGTFKKGESSPKPIPRKRSFDWRGEKLQGLLLRQRKMPNYESMKFGYDAVVFFQDQRRIALID